MPAHSPLTGIVHVEPVPALFGTLARVEVLQSTVRECETVGRCARLSRTDATSSLLLFVRYLATDPHGRHLGML